MILFGKYFLMDLMISQAFGPCDGGTPNEYHVYYYENGQKEREGQTGDFCKWEGIIKEYYESGKIKSKIQYEDGRTNGIAKYYNTTGKIIRQDSSHKNNIIYSKLIDTLELMTYEISQSENILKNNKMSRELSEVLPPYMNIKEIAIIENLIFIRADKSVLILNDSLNLEFNLIDSIMKYSPIDFNKLNPKDLYLHCGWYPDNSADTILYVISEGQGGKMINKRKFAVTRKN